MNVHALQPAPPTPATSCPQLQDVLAGLARDEFRLQYQPQVSCLDGRLVGFEALSRWQSPQFGAVPPEVFVALLEEADQTGALWQSVLANAARDLNELVTSLGQAVHVAINLSPQQLQNAQLASHFCAWLARHQIDGSQIHIEITESALLQSSPQMHANLARFAETGASLWLDDFGTGYSGLCHLRDLPVSGLKIDKRFIDNLETNLDDFRIVSAMIAMACSLGIKVVAEGVENEAQMQMLSQLGCTTLQGYLIGQPGDVPGLINNWSLSASA